MSLINFPQYDFGQTIEKKPKASAPSNDSSLLLMGLGILVGYLIFKSDDGNKIVGGLGDSTDPKSVDQEELKKGLIVEKEHTNDPEIAQEIALDHLTEDSHYYTHLEGIHKENPIKNPEGGLTQEGREHFGGHLQAGVKHVDTLEDLKRWGSWARRFYGRSVLPPMKNSKGEPTRIALDAQAWGRKIPKNKKQAKEIARRGTTALRLYKELKKKGLKKHDKVSFKLEG